MEEKDRSFEGFENSFDEVPWIIYAVSFELPFHRYFKQANLITEYQGVSQRNGNTCLDFKSSKKAGLKQFKCSLQQYFCCFK